MFRFKTDRKDFEDVAKPFQIYQPTGRSISLIIFNLIILIKISKKTA